MSFSSSAVEPVVEAVDAPGAGGRLAGPAELHQPGQRLARRRAQDLPLADPLGHVGERSRKLPGCRLVLPHGLGRLAQPLVQLSRPTVQREPLLHPRRLGGLPAQELLQPVAQEAHHLLPVTPGLGEDALVVLGLAVDLHRARGGGGALGAGDGVVVHHLQPEEEPLSLGEPQGRELQLERARVAPRRRQRPEHPPLLAAARGLHHQREIAQAEVVGRVPLDVNPGVGGHLHLAGRGRDGHLREGVGLDGHRDGRAVHHHSFTFRELEAVAARLLDEEGPGELPPVLHGERHHPARLRVGPLDGDLGPLHGPVGAGREQDLGAAWRLHRAVASRDLALGAPGVGRVAVGQLHVPGDGLGAGRAGRGGDAGDESRPATAQVGPEDQGRRGPGSEHCGERPSGPARRPVRDGGPQVDGAGTLTGPEHVLRGECGGEAPGFEGGPLCGELHRREEGRPEGVVPTGHGGHHLGRSPGRAPEGPPRPAHRQGARDDRQGEQRGAHPTARNGRANPHGDGAGEQGHAPGGPTPADGGEEHDRPPAPTGACEHARDLGVRRLHVISEQRRGSWKSAKLRVPRPRHKRPSTPDRVW